MPTAQSTARNGEDDMSVIEALFWIVGIPTIAVVAGVVAGLFQARDWRRAWWEANSEDET